MNKTFQIGRFTADPLVTKNADGTMRVAFSIAIPDRFRKDANGKNKTNFFNWTAFGKNAEAIAKYFSKGDQIFVCGEEVPYEDKNGVTRTGHTVAEWEFVGTRKRDSQPAHDAADQTSEPEDSFMNIPDGVSDEELPFN